MGQPRRCRARRPRPVALGARDGTEKSSGVGADGVVSARDGVGGGDTANERATRDDALFGLLAQGAVVVRVCR